MDPADLQGLPALVGPDRFRTYLDAVGGDAGQAIRLYSWNVEVSAAFWGPVQVIEVVLRNALHEGMGRLFDRSDWWTHPRVGLHHSQSEQVTTAEAKLTRRRAAYGPGHVVAELTMGFWTGLLGRGHAYEHRFWIPALRHAFPAYSGNRTDLHRTVESLRLFRNRIAHHEPIFARHLAADHDSILRLAAYIHPDARMWLSSHSRVLPVLDRRSEVIAGAQPTRF